jgi:DNA-binding IclR family transcriptional regulator
MDRYGRACEVRKQVPSDESSVRALARGLDILSLFASHGPELTQTGIAAALGLPLPTVHRLTATLVARGFLLRDERSRRLRLGLEVLRLVAPTLTGLRVPDLAREPLRALAEETGETVNLAVLDEGEVIYLASQAGRHLLTPQVPPGLRLPPHCTALGKCLLAQLAEPEARALLGPEPYAALTPRTRTRWDALRDDLARARRERAAVSLEEYEPGLASVAVALAPIEGRPAAMNVSLPTARATAERRAALLQRLRRTAEAVDASLRIAA